MSRSSAPPPVPASNTGLYVAAALLLLGGTAAIVYFKFLKKDPPTVAEVLPPASPSASAAGNENPALYEVPPPVRIAPPSDAGSGTAGPGVTPIAPAGNGGCDSPCRGVDTPALANAVRGRVSTARQCYNRALANDPNLKGQVGVSLRIGPSGSVCSAGVTSTTLHSPGVEQCALATLRNASYPPPSGGCKDVGATLVFTPGK